MGAIISGIVNFSTGGGGYSCLPGQGVPCFLDKCRTRTEPHRRPKKKPGARKKERRKQRRGKLKKAQKKQKRGWEQEGREIGLANEKARKRQGNQKEKQD